MAEILSYNLQWDAGSSGTSFVELVGESTDYELTTFTVSTGIVAGWPYYFRVRARNGLGWGPVSTSAAVKAATKPDQMDAATTAIDSATGGVIVTFTEPEDNSQGITAYRIEVAHGSDWSEELTSCDGSDATVMSNMQCIIPMSALRDTAFGLGYGELIQVRA
jgi:hypothetical protein